MGIYEIIVENIDMESIHVEALIEASNGEDAFSKRPFARNGRKDGYPYRWVSESNVTIEDILNGDIPESVEIVITSNYRSYDIVGNGQRYRVCAASEDAALEDLQKIGVETDGMSVSPAK